jgi:uncharacterized protein YndB with AHSA1/START domain
MSKKNKVSSAKAKPASKSKKSAKPASKPNKVAKKAPAKKQKPVKKVVAKASKAKVAPKKAAPKKPVAKAKKPVKATKPVKAKVVTNSKPVKKAAPKKVVKPAAKKVAPKKPVAKAVAKKEIKKVEATKTVVKKVIPVKPIEQNHTPVKAVAKKEVVADDDKKNDVLAIMNTIPKTEVPQLSASKIASITSSITNPIKKQGAYAVKTEKEPNGKFEIEFGFRASPEMLYEFFSTASGLSEWFCDDVNIRNGIYTFIWDGQMQQARLLKTVDNQLARYQWVDKTDGSYFEFRIERDDLTNDISLIVTDFADSKADQESAKLLWHSQVEKLMHVIGSIF